MELGSGAGWRHTARIIQTRHSTDFRDCTESRIQMLEYSKLDTCSLLESINWVSAGFGPHRFAWSVFGFCHTVVDSNSLPSSSFRWDHNDCSSNNTRALYDRC